MNAPNMVPTDGLIRRSFTVADVDRMVEVGIIDPDERLEIIAGEIFPMSPKGNRHEVLKQHLNRLFGRTLAESYAFVPECGWQLSEHTYLEPDFLFYPADLPFAAVKGADALLVIEIADSSLGYDLGRKPAIYAAEGVREYWVIEAITRTTHVHLQPGSSGYGSLRAYPAEVGLEPQHLRGLSIRLADLPQT